MILVRNQVLGCAENDKLIARDMFTLDWIKELDVHLPTLMVVSSVYQYFDETIIIAIIKAVKQQLLHGELIFDATNSRGLKFANSYVKITGDLDVQMHFSVDEPQELRILRIHDLKKLMFFLGCLKKRRGLK